MRTKLLFWTQDSVDENNTDDMIIREEGSCYNIIIIYHFVIF